MTKSRRHELLIHALAYARRGWAVVPLHSISPDGCTCGDPSCGAHAGKHPRIKGGAHAATTDEARIKEWWRKCPDANIGIATGQTSGILVVDIDPRNGGDDELAKLFGANSEFLQKTLRVATGGGGWHYYLQMPDFPVKNMTGKYALRPGVEIKSTGGFVVAPPSTHLSGHNYKWDVSPKEGSVLELPDWFAALLQETSKGKAKTGPVTMNASIAEGERNTALTSLGGRLRNQGAEEQEILIELLRVNAERCNPPLAENEVAQIAHSLIRYSPEENPPIKLFRFTDLGNAKRFVYLHGEHIRYCWPWKTWLIWDGRRWKRDERHAILALVHDTVRRMYSDAAEIAQEADRQALVKHALSTESGSRLNNMLSLSRSLPGVPVTPGELDMDAWVLNVTNGTIHLQTGELTPHAPESNITKLIDVPYQPDAQCPTWLSFLSRIMDGDDVLIEFLQKAIGYSLTGDVSEQVIFFCYGSTGKNGKSTFLNTVKTLLGDYSQGMQPETLMVKQGLRINNDIARLQGVRFVAAIEGEEGQRLSESLIKQMTGGDVITARYLHQEFFEFLPTHKIFFATNHKPLIRGTDDAIWRRIRLIPFNVTIPEEERDNQLPQKLLDELPGILRWAVEGCLMWQHEGLGVPPEVSEATSEYRGEMDILAKFIDECCVVHLSAHVAVSDLYATYQEWCSANGERPINHRLFANKLKERGFRSGHSGAIRRWNGIGLAAHDTAGPDGTFRTPRDVKSDKRSVFMPFVKKNAETVSRGVPTSQLPPTPPLVRTPSG